MSDVGLEALLSPRGIAIVGATDRPGTWPQLVWNNLQRFGYPHPVYPVNPRRDEVWGARCYPSLSALPETPDLAVVIVPADASLDVIEEAGRCGVRAANIFSSGFGEGGDREGLERAERLRGIVHETGIRVCGPNCMGNLTSRARAVTVANAYIQTVEPGPVALVGQSGGILMSVHRALDDRAIGLSYLVMSGDETDLSLADYIRFFADDADTRVIGVFLEAVRDAGRFLAACDYARERGKPIVAIKVGASQRGREAALAHTGALAGSTLVFETVARDHGVVCVGSFDDLVETTELLLHLDRPPPGRRVGVIAASGGLKSLMLDLAEQEGVELPDLAPHTMAALEEVLPVGASAGNPIDHGAGGVGREVYQQCVELMMADENVDFLLLQGELPRSPETKNRNFEQINELAAASPKPIAYFSMVSHSVTEYGRDFRREMPNLALLQGADKALRAVRSATDYYIRSQKSKVQSPRSKPPAHGEPVEPWAGSQGAGRAARDSGPRAAPEADAKRLLEHYGLVAPREASVGNVDDAARAASAIGFPVVLKVVAEDVTHKTDVGGVKLGLTDERAVRRAYAEIEAALAQRGLARLRGVLVCEQVELGLEVILAFQRDVDMGQVIMLGLGGTLVELVRRVSFRKPPIDPAEAEELIAEISIGPFLDGYRGAPPLDRDALVRAIVDLGRLAVQEGEGIETLEINPLAVLRRGEGVRVLDALLVLEPSGAVPSPVATNGQASPGAGAGTGRPDGSGSQP